MDQPRHREEAVEVVNGERAVLLRKRVYRLVIMHAEPRADQLVRPADVVQHLSVVRRARERGQVWGDSLRSKWRQ